MKIALCRSLIGIGTSSAKSSSPTSQNVGVAPVNIGAAQVALMVIAGQINLSSALSPTANAAAINPDVAELQAMACLTLNVFAHAFSSAETSGPPCSLPAR